MNTVTLHNGILEIFELPESANAAVEHARDGQTSQRLLAEGAQIHIRFSTKDKSCAQASIWFDSVPPHEGKRVAAIGHYYAESDEAGVCVLEQVFRLATEDGAGLVVGPMNGNTWRNYRLVTDFGERSAFFLEPFTEKAMLSQWSLAGFRPLHDYQSVYIEAFQPVSKRIEAARQRYMNQGIQFRQPTQESFESDLEGIHALSLKAFVNNPFYTDLPWSHFREQYRKIEPYLRFDCIELAFYDQKLVGFCFAIPDYLELSGSGNRLPDTLIVKTLAIDSGKQFRGLGVVLVAVLEARARDIGFRHGIHALEAIGNNSTRISAKAGTVMRQYSLLCRKSH